MEGNKTNTYTGLDIFQPLRKAQTGVRVDVTPADHVHIDDAIRQDIEKTLPKTFPLSKEYIQQRIDYIILQIHDRLGGGYGGVSSFSTEDGMYRFFDKSGRELYRANLLKLWNESNLSPKKIADIQRKAKEEEMKLREVLDRESVMGGSIVMEFVVTGAVGAAVGTSLLDATRHSLNGISIGTRKLKNLWIKNPNGVMEKVPLGDMVFQGSKDWMRSNVLRVLERVGIYYDPVSKTGINVGAKAITELIRIFEKITLAELRAKYGLSISEAEFYRFRSELPQFARLMQQSGNSVIEMTKWAVGKGLHVIMFPVFFSTFQRQPNSATLLVGVAEMMIFNQGAKLGGVVGKFTGPIGRGLGPIIGGIGGVAGSHLLYGKVDGEIEKWKIFNGRDMFSSKSSVIGYAATFGFVSDYFDLLNNIGPTLSEKIGSKGGFDVGIRSFDLGTVLPESWAKKGPIGYITGGSGVTLDVDFYKRKVAFNMNPWEWFNAGMTSRTVEKWNTMVDAYRENLLRDLAKLLGAFQGSQYPFSQEQTLKEKKRILEERLMMLLLPVGSSMFQPQANSVVLLVLSEVGRWNQDTSMNFIRDGVDNYVSYMKIDPTFIRLNKVKILAKGEYLKGEFEKLAKQMSNPTQAQYVRSIYGRVMDRKPIFAPDTIVADDNPFSDSAHVEPSEEHKLFNSLLNSKDQVDRDSFDASGNPSVEKMETRKLFAILLDELSLQGQLIGFQKRISNIAPDQNVGEFIEIEAVKSLFN